MAKSILFFIFLVLLMTFCTQCHTFASSSYFGKIDTIKVKIYFLRSDECCLAIELVPIECIVENNMVEKLVRTVLEKLLKGPTEQEMERLDIWTSIPKGVKVNNVRIDKDSKTVFVDFSEELQNYGGGSLSVLCIREQIERTLMEFPSIGEVVITVEGKNEKDGVLQP